MQKTKLTIAAALLVIALPLLQGCAPAIIATGAAVGVMSYQDRRPTTVQTEDESIEWKAARSVPEHFAAASHLNFTSFNRRLMITGEVPSEEAKAAIGEQAAKVAGVREVFNEVTIGPA
ncbi:MAG TPA: BON domain-containing protein, partial [Azonexus sp.]|nr:BON domain-containing protein [Azonexus sp.]